MPEADDAAVPGVEQPDSLARGSYRARQRATLEMWRGRSHPRQAVQDATRHPDPEISERAEWILRQWRSGVLPGVGDSSDGTLFHRDSPTALAAVMEQGAFAAVLVAVEESAGTIEFDQIKSRVATMLSERYPFYTEKAFAAGTEQDLLKLVEAVAISRDFATCARDLRRHLGLQPVSDDPLPPSSSNWEPSEREIYLAQLATLDGDFQQAIEASRRSGDPVLERIALMIAGQWQQIGQAATGDAENAASHEERIEAASWMFAAAHRVEDAAMKDRARHWLLIEEPIESEMVQNLRWRSLAIHGEIDSAIEILAKRDPTAAAKVACVSSRFRRAEELCGYKLSSIERDFDRWIKEAYAEQAKLDAGEIAPEMERLYSFARLLVNIGDTATAERIYARLTPRQIIVSPYGLSLREQTIRELAPINRFEWMMDIAVAKGENAISRRTSAIVADALGMDYLAFATLVDRCSLFAKRNDFRDQFRIAFQLARGELPDGFDGSKDFRRLYDAIVHQPPMAVGTRLAQPDETFALHMDLVDIFVRHGESRLAREGMEVLRQRGNLDALITTAESELEQGTHAVAGGRWQAVADAASNASPGATGVTTDLGIALAKSLVGQWILAKRSGYRSTAEELEMRIRLMLTSPSLAFRKDLADYLRESGQYELAINSLQELVVLSAFGGGARLAEGADAATTIGAIEEMVESDPDGFARLGLNDREAVRWSDLAIFGIVKSAGYYDSAFISVPLSIRKSFLQYAIDSRDPELAQKAISDIESFDPLNIDYGERVLPLLRAAGMHELADRALDRLMETGMSHLRSFRGDSTARNNLAWTAAMNNRRLDEALELSRLAVTAEPDSVIYRDTLAEVLHLLGRTEEALAIESACLLDEPDEWHLYEQIKKYREILDARDADN